MWARGNVCDVGVELIDAVRANGVANSAFLNIRAIWADVVSTMPASDHRSTTRPDGDCSTCREPEWDGSHWTISDLAPSVVPLPRTTWLRRPAEDFDATLARNAKLVDDMLAEYEPTEPSGVPTDPHASSSAIDIELTTEDTVFSQKYQELLRLHSVHDANRLFHVWARSQFADACGAGTKVVNFVRCIFENTGIRNTGIFGNIG